MISYPPQFIPHDNQSKYLKCVSLCTSLYTGSIIRFSYQTFMEFIINSEGPMLCPDALSLRINLADKINNQPYNTGQSFVAFFQLLNFVQCKRTTYCHSSKLLITSLTTFRLIRPCFHGVFEPWLYFPQCFHYIIRPLLLENKLTGKQVSSEASNSLFNLPHQYQHFVTLLPSPSLHDR